LKPEICPDMLNRAWTGRWTISLGPMFGRWLVRPMPACGIKH